MDLTRAFCKPELWPPNAFILGCDAFGNNLAIKILKGGLYSLAMSLSVTLITMGIGLVVGSLAAFSSRPKVESLVSRFDVFTRLIDTFLAFPGILLALLIAVVLPQSQFSIIFALCTTGWAGYARFCRSFLIKEQTETYLEALAASGASNARILLRHLWPALLPHLLIQGSMHMSQVIFAEAALSFLGLGSALENPSLGKLIAAGRDYLIEAPHLSLFPGLALTLLIVAFHGLAEYTFKPWQPRKKYVSSWANVFSSDLKA